AIGVTPVVFSIICSCAGDATFTEIQNVTTTIFHELVEAATDPYVQTNEAYAQTDDDDAAWTFVTSGELADMCEYDTDAYVVPADMTYMIQRSWSNAAAKAGHSPCVPPLNEPYFNTAAIVSDSV